MFRNLSENPHPEPRGSGDLEPAGAPDVATARTLLTVVLTAALALVLASTYPLGVMPVVLSSLLFWGALGGVLLALWRQEPIDAGHLTGWDQAAMLLALSLLAGFFVDPAAVEALLEGAAESSTAR